MPKTVDHDERRKQIVAATWRIIARHGMAHATMRQIAQEAGFANGAIKPYFSTKAELLQATYAHVFERTNSRVAEVVASSRGLDALTAFCREVIPLDAERLDESRVVIEFWAEATADIDARRLHEDSMAKWRAWMLGWLHEIDAHRDWAETADALLSFLTGTQALAVMDSASTPANLDAQLQLQLRLLTA